ncbi:hypothetical protein BaRGS_00025563 [Batillaria attramentaria]|uniref:Uncharacterized protein n=1 Tax=Batillaria attramentaria TaxID=370345 RepID=A0ABD0K733_9CAEN
MNPRARTLQLYWIHTHALMARSGVESLGGCVILSLGYMQGSQLETSVGKDVINVSSVCVKCCTSLGIRMNSSAVNVLLGI